MIDRGTTIDSPLGRLALVAGDSGLRAILWPGDLASRVPLGPLVEDATDPVLVETARQLDAYFAGRRTTFSVPLDFRGTPFQRDVWRALLTIPYGETRSYGDIARQIGRPTAFRAVGAANGRNPISIIAPCHRVVGSTGTLTGFAGGLAAKDFLLGLEQGRADAGPTEPTATAIRAPAALSSIGSTPRRRSPSPARERAETSRARPSPER